MTFKVIVIASADDIRLDRSIFAPVIFLLQRVDPEMDDILEEDSSENEGAAKAALNQSEQPAEETGPSVGDDAEAPDAKVPFLQLDLEGLTDILLHCHYVTRP
jgi:hypothetical protein